MKRWQIEYSNSHPYMNIRFTVEAENYDQADVEARKKISQLRRTACYEIGPLETERRRNGDGEPL
jgi:hypothetical protein